MSAQVKPFPPIGMNPSVWGPVLWTTMHIVTLGYSPMPTEEEKAAAIQFFESLVFMIPCPICREHYKMHIEKYPVRNAVGSRDMLIYWVFSVHNEVNKQLKKKELTVEEFIQHLQRLSAKERIQIPEPTPPPDYSLPIYGGTGLALGVIVGIAGYYFYQKHK